MPQVQLPLPLIVPQLLLPLLSDDVLNSVSTQFCSSHSVSSSLFGDLACSNAVLQTEGLQISVPPTHFYKLRFFTFNASNLGSPNCGVSNSVLEASAFNTTILELCSVNFVFSPYTCYTCHTGGNRAGRTGRPVLPPCVTCATCPNRSVNGQ